MVKAPSADMFAGLTDRERDVLRLLASGHTVKTIAAQLGASEAAINERLRDARRKTGVGSSRELARLLDAQKIWDRKIDLPADSAPVNPSIQPANAGRFRSKGQIIMLITLAFAAAAMVAVATPSVETPSALAVAARPSPLVGSWALDVARIPESERPQRVTISFRVAPDGKWTTLVEIMAPDGSSQHAESTAAVDGVPVPISGTMGAIDTVALRQPAPNTLVMTLGKGGTPVSTRVYAVSKDRTSMTETIVWAGGTLPKLETTYFSRID
jgi:DNA-binding CsgD family transcriptional regulator